jgi:hypothetical protein
MVQSPLPSFVPARIKGAGSVIVEEGKWPEPKPSLFNRRTHESKR